MIRWKSLGLYQNMSFSWTCPNVRPVLLPCAWLGWGCSPPLVPLPALAGLCLMRCLSGTPTPGWQVQTLSLVLQVSSPSASVSLVFPYSPYNLCCVPTCFPTTRHASVLPCLHWSSPFYLECLTSVYWKTFSLNFLVLLTWNNEF